MPEGYVPLSCFKRRAPREAACSPGVFMASFRRSFTCNRGLSFDPAFAGVTMRTCFGMCVLLAVLLVSFFCSATLHAAETEFEKSMEEFVKKVIQENPELIYKVLNDYVKERKNRRVKDQQENAFENRVTDDYGPEHPVLGPEDAPIVIMEYTDFECPFCRRGAETMRELLGIFPEEVRLVFKNLPLKSHSQALPAAKAALAAKRQGQFWEYHDRLFAQAGGLGEGLYEELAEDLGLDVPKFNADRASQGIADQVEGDMARAKDLGVTGTPTFIVNGVVVRGARSTDYFVSIVERLLTLEDKKE